MNDTKKDTLEELINELKLYESEDQLVFALDFGTTFSGIAYAFTKADKPELVSILDWPGLESRKVPKVPTIISYDPSDSKSFAWGAQRHVHPKIEGIKLLLDPSMEQPLYIPATSTRAALKKLGKPPMEVAADYIEAICKHAMGRIESKVPVQFLQMCQKKYVLSVPAVWSDKAKDLTLRAAREAGMQPVTLIKEPEAAALYTLHVLKDHALAVGDAFVVCDAGGGTVDLISYEIQKLKPRLETKELVSPKGGMAGSMQLNKRFEEAVKELVGEDQYVQLRKTEAYNAAVEEFDKVVKPAFRGTQGESWFINFPMADLEDDPANDLKRNTWQLKGETVKDIFKPLITDILRMVDDQVNLVKNKRLNQGHPQASHIKAIFLVGGFGASEYLKQCVQESHPDVQVIQPHDAWSAIVKGAVLSQLPNEAVVTSTVAPRHYGVAAMEIFDEVRDKDQPKMRDEVAGTWRVNRITWYICKGDDLKRDRKRLFHFFRTFNESFSDDELVIKTDLIMDDSARASEYPRDGVTKANCTLTVDLRGVDRNYFVRRIGNNGRPYVDLHYDLVVTTRSAMMKFSLEIQGKELGSVEAKYE